MGLTSTLYAGLSGLDANGVQFEVIGNNIANVNTTGFKSRRVLFQTQFARTLDIGSLATGEFGGINPMQIGLGAQVAQIDTDFDMGSVEVTGVNSDLAIEGRGFFVVKDAQGQNTYTRNGSFTVNSVGDLVSGDGKFVQGYQVDDDFNLISGALANLTIPLGFLTIARATENAVIQGNLNAAGEVGSSGNILDSMQLEDLGGNPVTDDTLMTEVCDSANPGVALFAVGDTVTVTGVRGGRTLPTATFTVDATSRLGHSALVPEANRFARFLECSLGLDTTGTAPGNAGVIINASSLRIESNYGTQNAITMANTAIRVNTTGAPFTWAQDDPVNPTLATGESVYTSFTVYDSLGTPMTMDLAFVLEQASSTGTTWRFYASSADDTDIDLVLGNGIVQFDTSGQYVTSTDTNLSIDRAATGAVTPQAIEVGLASMTSLAADMSEIALSSQDGVPIGTLSGFGVGADGVITGTFTNGLTRSMGQIAIATFANPKGLLDVGQSTYTEGPNSGVATITAPLQMSAGSVHAGALELSNVDLSTEFVNLITTSTGFTANSRVISTADEMMREILTMVR